MVGAGHSFRTVFDAPTRADDVWFCTADCGWITGHTYVAYGPLLNGATQIVFEGVPSWPDAGRLWRIVDQHKVTHLYTAPTAIRALMRSGDDPVTATSRASLKLLGSVGEPINPEAFWRRPLCSLLVLASRDARSTRRANANPRDRRRGGGTARSWATTAAPSCVSRRPVVCLPCSSSRRGLARGEPTVERCRASRHRSGAIDERVQNAGRHVVADRDGRDPDRADDGRRRGPAQARGRHDARRRLRAGLIGRDDGRRDPGGHW